MSLSTYNPAANKLVAGWVDRVRKGYVSGSQHPAHRKRYQMEGRGRGRGALNYSWHQLGRVGGFQLDTEGI